MKDGKVLMKVIPTMAMELPPLQPQVSLRMPQGIKFRTNSVRLPRNLSPMLAYFVGFLRDGTLDKDERTFGVKIYQKDKKFLENVINNMSETLFGKRAKIVNSDADFAWQLSSKPLSLFIRENFDYPENFRQTHWDVPKVILESPWEIQRWYIAGFCDAEASIVRERDRNNSLAVYIFQSWHNQNGCPPLQNIKRMMAAKGITCYWPQLYKRDVNAYYLRFTYRQARNFIAEIPLLKKSALPSIKKS